MPTNSIASQVAVLISTVERIENRLNEDRKDRKAESEAVTKMVAHDRANAEMTRSAVSAELTDIRHGQDDVLRRLAAIEPVTDLVTSVWSKVMGGMMLLGVLGGIAWAGIVFFKEIIVGWFQ